MLPDLVASPCGPLLLTTSWLSTMSCEPSSEVVTKVYMPDRPMVRKPAHRTLNSSGGAPFQRCRILAADSSVSLTENAGEPFQFGFVKYCPTSPLPASSEERTAPRRTQTRAAARSSPNGRL